MKKAIATIFSVFYLLVTVGMAVQVHYCAGEIASVQLFSETNSCCGDEGDCNANCCHYSSQVIQFEEQQTLLSNFKPTIEQPVFELAVSASPASPDLPVQEDESVVDDELRPPPNEPVWLLHCSLVYYG
jgi:hypothetical protein